MLVIDVFEGSSFGYVLSNEFVEQFNMGLVYGTVGFGKKTGTRSALSMDLKAINSDPLSFVMECNNPIL
ncbi:hypothetical protein, partial [Porphyromonas endodontalis]|uniref:hypothetical protein n=1 Tax=Porphyromonas endodontalis TaxID=28124 RepID=UPI00360D2305